MKKRQRRHQRSNPLATVSRRFCTVQDELMRQPENAETQWNTIQLVSPNCGPLPQLRGTMSVLSGPISGRTDRETIVSLCKPILVFRMLFRVQFPMARSLNSSALARMTRCCGKDCHHSHSPIILWSPTHSSFPASLRSFSIL